MKKVSTFKRITIVTLWLAIVGAGIFAYKNKREIADWIASLFGGGEQQSLTFDQIPNQNVEEGKELAFPATARAKIELPPGQQVIYSLGPTAPPGCQIDPATGVFTWTPRADQGPQKHEFTLLASVPGQDGLNAQTTVAVQVYEPGHEPPIIDPIPYKTVKVGDEVKFTASVSNIDPSKTTLTFNLDPGAPSGSSINPRSGEFIWKVDKKQAAGTYEMVVRVEDDRSPPLSSSQKLSVRVTGDDPPGPNEIVEVPFITWGGDMATFYANGDTTTQPGTIFDKLGLKLKLTNGDDFNGQVERYLRGETDFLRGTYSMLGLASGKINSSAQNEAVVFLQLTWSAGDHMVARKNCRRLSDLKGKKVAIQEGGPHVGMLNDALRTAELTWDDIEVEWVSDLTGDNGPAALFEKDSSVDACMVISPDMAALTGDDFAVDSVGPNGEHVLISTAWMSRSICDVYACRKKFFEQHRELVDKFTAGYLKACHDVVVLKSHYDDKDDKSSQYKEFEKLLNLSVNIFTEEVIPSPEDAHGLISDCSFVRLPGNNSFFTDASNRSGFNLKHEAALELPGKLNKGKGLPFAKADFDYARIKQLAANPDPVTAEPWVGPPPPHIKGEELEQATIHYFTIPFETGQTKFPPGEYGDSFQRAIDQASLWGRAGILVRGHADTTLVLKAFVEEGMKRNEVIRKGSSPNITYTDKKTGSKIDLTDVPEIAERIQQAAWPRPEFLLEECQDLSQQRADEVTKQCVAYAKSKGFRLAGEQIAAVGVGILEPVVPKPSSSDEAAKNRRVEFRIIKIDVEAGGGEDTYHF